MKSIALILGLGLASLLSGCGSGKSRAFRSFVEVDQSELGQCCQSCTSSIGVDSGGALTYSSTGAVPCHGQLTPTETTAFASLVTRPDVVQALSNRPACGADGVEDMSLAYDDGTVIDDPAVACASGPLEEVKVALSGYVTEYCPSITCLSGLDGAAD